MTNKPRAAPALFTLAALVTAVAALVVAREILLPIALATLISFLLAPLAKRLERWRIPRIPAVLAVVGVAFATLGLLGWVVTSQLIDLSDKLPSYRENIIAKVRAVTHGSKTFEGVAETIEDVQEELSADTDARDAPPVSREVSEQPSSSSDASGVTAWVRAQIEGSAAGNDGAVRVKVVSLPPSPLAQVRSWLGPLVAPLTTAGMVVVLVLFMLLQREDQRNRVIRLFGSSNLHATTEALTEIVDRVSRYLRMQFLINASYGICVSLGLALIGLPNAVMWGVLSFSLRFLPYIGPWISAVLPVAVSLAISDGWTQPMLVVAWFLTLELIVNNVAEPLLYGSTIGVSGMGVILAAIFWTWLWGPIGLVLAMPLTVCLVVMANYVPALRFITVLLGDQPTLTLEERIYQRMLALDEDELRRLAQDRLEQNEPTDFYDSVLIPALRLAERDRHAGVLTEDQEQAVQDLARDLIADLGGEVEANAPADVPAAKARVYCIPLRDHADETAALMLRHLLREEGIATLIAPLESLTSERVEAAESVAADIVVVSVLPPLPQRESRLLCRRLRKRYPTLPIIVGFWSGLGGDESTGLLASPSDGDVSFALADAVTRVRAIAARIGAAANNGNAAEAPDVELSVAK